ncbi:hypothetical protein SADUNF_Sadunf18G0050500 [Salix dunnii]|uniref:BRX domain-containing protein n=1 Tax=Salix dunnii TaxID=1413687 RepID=A0A835J411_9ROSI|nr:hypothetical protein SADUNF_Sadunf18G0050500 [Salix dunnii]
MISHAVTVSFPLLSNGGFQTKFLHDRCMVVLVRASPNACHVPDHLVPTLSSIYNDSEFCIISLISRDMLNKWQPETWWAENYDRIMELYDVQRFNRQASDSPKVRG